MRTKVLTGLVVLAGSTFAFTQISSAAQGSAVSDPTVTPTPTPSPTPTPEPSPTPTPAPQR